MTHARWRSATAHLIRGLLWLYPRDFREELGHDLIATYRDRADFALARGGVSALLLVWLDAVRHSLHQRSC